MSETFTPEEVFRALDKCAHCVEGIGDFSAKHAPVHCDVCRLREKARKLLLKQRPKPLTVESVTIEIVAVGPPGSGKTQALAEIAGQIIHAIDDDNLSFVPSAGELHLRAMVPLDVDTSNVTLRAEVRHNGHAEVPRDWELEPDAGQVPADTTEKARRAIERFLLCADRRLRGGMTADQRVAYYGLIDALAVIQNHEQT